MLFVPEQVRSVSVQPRRVPLAELKVAAPRLERRTSVEASMRLDALASAGFRVSRSAMTDMIKKGDVRCVRKPAGLSALCPVVLHALRSTMPSSSTMTERSEGGAWRAACSMKSHAVTPGARPRACCGHDRLLHADSVVSWSSFSSSPASVS